jgi:antitoxin component YwqK of YwqJK toxin-antitoxin module
MKRLLLIVLPLLLIVGCSKEPINHETTLVNRKGVFYTNDTNEPYSGKVFSLYEDGKKKDEGTYKDGFRHGNWTYYTEVGNSKYNVTYKAGTYNLVVFTDNLGTNYTGSPVTDEPEQDGTYLLRRDEYDFSKTPVAFGTIKNGKFDGLYTFWHDNGQKRREGTYKDGKFDGEWTYWYEDGKKKDEGTYKNGEKDGLYTSWHENGQKQREGTYKDGKNHGLWTTWYVNGQKRYEETYKDGEITDYKILDVDKEFELAETFRIQNNYKEAISILNRLVKIKSEVSPEAQYLIAEIYYRDMQDFTTAIKQYGNLRIQFSDSKQVPFSLFMQGFIYANMLADFENAKDHYSQFLQKYPDHELFQSVGFELKYLGRDIKEIPELKHLTQ